MRDRNLSNFWEKDVIKSDKHFVDQLTDEKIQRMTTRVNKYFLEKLDFTKIKTTLDWGCGGGLFAKMLSEKSEVILADISNESLKHAKEYIGKDLQSILIPNKIDDFEYKNQNIDLLFCHTVIHHFPTKEYWNKVFNIWTTKIRPKYFALQIKIGDETKEKNNYFDDYNYLNALYLKEDEFVEKFLSKGYIATSKEYKINYYKNPDQIIKVGYFIFEQKQ